MGRGRQKKIPWDVTIFLIITSIAFVLSIIKIINPESNGLIFASESPQVFPIEGFTRAPASADNSILDVGCVRNSGHVEKMVSSNGSVRVKGQLCHISSRRMKRLEGITVKNLTNGYEGTIFFQGTSNAFMTDFLVLQDGKNVIQLEWKEENDREASLMTAEIYEPSSAYNR